MKLTAKVITAVVNALGKNREGTYLKVTAEEFQKRVLKKANLTLEEIGELGRLAKKAGFSGYFKPITGKQDYSEYIGGSRNYQYKYYKVEIVDGSVMSYSGWTNQIVKELVLAAGAKESTNVDYTVALSAFSTVEEAIEAYPHLQPTFEAVFGVRF